MAKKIKKQDKGGRVEISGGKLMEGIVKGVGALLNFVVDLEKKGQSEYKEEGEIEGKTKNGKKIKGAYGFRIKVGLNPEEMKKGHPQLKAKNES
jgi:hypothetical protein